MSSGYQLALAEAKKSMSVVTQAGERRRMMVECEKHGLVSRFREVCPDCRIDELEAALKEIVIAYPLEGYYTIGTRITNAIDVADKLVDVHGWDEDE